MNVYNETLGKVINFLLENCWIVTNYHWLQIVTVFTYGRIFVYKLGASPIS